MTPEEIENKIDMLHEKTMGKVKHYTALWQNKKIGGGYACSRIEETMEAYGREFNELWDLKEEAL